MYGRVVGTSTVVGTGGAGVLAATGMHALGVIVAACTLLAAGFALLRLAPRRRRR